MKDLMWGTCGIAVAKKEKNGTYGVWEAFPKPVENSTTLTTTKGEKKEAKTEGGIVEAVKYAPNSYSLASSFRLGMVDGQKISLPVKDHDGIVEGVYAFRLQPENKDVIGIFVKEAVITVEDSYTAADGATKVVTFDFLRPDTPAGEDQEPTINWEVIPDLLGNGSTKENA